MKFTIKRKAAHAAMGALHGTVLARTTIPILQNVLISAHDGLLTLTVTDLDQCCTFAVADAQIAVGGATTVPFGKLREIVAASPEGCELVFSSAETRLNVMAGNARYALPQLPASDFPVMSPDGAEASFTIEAGVLARLLAAGGFAAAASDARGYLCSVYMHTPEPDVLRVVSTDAYRFTYCDAPAPEGFAWPKGTMLAPSTVASIERLLTNVAPDAPVSVELAAARAVLGIGQATLVTKVVDGSYARYQAVIPSEFVAELTIDVDLLEAAAQRAMIMGDSKTGRVGITIEPGLMKFRAANMEGGEANDEIAIDYDGQPLSLGVQGAWFREMLGHVKTESVRLKLADFSAGRALSETLTVTFLDNSESDWYGMLAPRSR